jgi:hypothetical protein
MDSLWMAVSARATPQPMGCWVASASRKRIVLAGVLSLVIQRNVRRVGPVMTWWAINVDQLAVRANCEVLLASALQQQIARGELVFQVTQAVA